MIHIYADSAWYDGHYGCCRVTAYDYETGEVIRVIECEHKDAEPGELLNKTVEQLSKEMLAEGYKIL